MSPMRRWTIRITSAGGLLLLALALGVQIILWTDLPRRWILRILTADLGLAVDAESISVSWMGQTTVRQVTVRRSLNPEDLLAADTVGLSHHSILGLVFTRSLGLKSIRIERPQLYLRRDAEGRWNVQEVAGDLLNGLGGGPLDLTGARWPHVSVEGASVRVAEPNGQVETIGPFAFEGSQQAPLVWRFALTDEPAIRMDGRVMMDKGGLIELDHLSSELGALGAQLSGQWDLAAQTGRLDASWAARLPGQGEHNGTCQVTVRSPASGRKEARLTTTLAGQGALGSWRIAAQAEGSGALWGQSIWRASMQEGTWSWKSQRMQLDGGSAEIALDWPVVRLVNLVLPNASQLEAAAQYDASKSQWFVRLDGQGIRLFKEQADGLAVHLNAEGTDANATVSDFRVTQGQTALVAKGQLLLPSYELKDAHLQAQWHQTMAQSSGGQRSESEGQWSCEADVSGIAKPVKLDVHATLAGNRVALGQRTVPKLDIPLRCSVDAERITIETGPFHLLDGLWQASGQHRFAGPLTQFDVTVRDLSVQAAAEMAGSPIKCEGSANAQLQVAVPNLDIKQASAQGTWDVTNLQAPPLKAQRAHGRLLIEGGLARLDEIELTEDSGTARGDMRFSLDQPQRLFIGFATTRWPLRGQIYPIDVLLDSKAQIEMDVVKKTLVGQCQLWGRLLCDDNVLGQSNASVILTGRTMQVKDLTGELLGGTIEGAAKIPLDQWTNAAGQLQWHDVQPSRLAVCWLPAERWEGRLSGSLTAVEDANQPRALGPMRLELKTQSADGHIGPAQLGDCNAVAFLGPQRLLIDRADLHLMGGQLKAWGRLSPHANMLNLSLGVDFNDVDLNQFMYLVGMDKQTLIGRLSGQGTLLTSTDLSYLDGQAYVNISKSDLGDNKIIQTLYNGLRLSLGKAKPEGTGQVNIQLDGSRIVFPSFVYFNRGVEVRGTGQIDDFKRGGASPVRGYAVGSTRVLKNVRLPGISELDRLMTSLQSGAATVVIGGTLGKVDARLVPLPEVRASVRDLLWEQLRQKK